MGLSLLNCLFDLDRQNTWLRYVNDNGFLACIVNSLQSDNALLEECFHTDTKNNKVIFVFETKMVKYKILFKYKFKGEIKKGQLGWHL